MRLLIADDSAYLLERLAEVFSEVSGVEIIGQAKNVNEVIKEVERHRPDLVILDIKMPGGNGFSALEQIKQREDPPVVIMFTNYPYLQYRKKSMDLGADYFFYKAIEFNNLIDLIKELVQLEAQT
jgi:DNA-binding NarL/FixJ family response regulator